MSVRTVLNKVYPYLPVSVQNAGISAYGYVYKRERFGREFAPTLAAFEERDRWDVDRFREYTTQALRQIAARAFDVPLYRDSWGAAGLSPTHLVDITPEALHRLPILRKESLR